MPRSALLEEEEILSEEPAALPAPAETIQRMRHAVLSGQHWFEALLDAIGRWRLPEERIADRDFCYLIRGEAFDWLLLAERLLDEMPDLTPRRAVEALLFDGIWPLDLSDEEFAERLGHAKHSAHLNYLYGVLVEQALQLSVEEEIHKESNSRVWGQDTRVDETMYQRVYGKSRMELCAAYYEETRERLRGEVDFASWQSFIYWLFTFRLRRQDKARIASDTRKGLAQLTRMELAVSHRRHGAHLDEAAFRSRYVGQ